MPRSAQQHRPPAAHATRDASQWASRQAERRRAYNTEAWRRLRAFVIKRDRALCQQCLRDGRYQPVALRAKRGSGALQAHVDHRDPAVSLSDVLCDERNLQTLCPPCHSRKTRRQGGGSNSTAFRPQTDRKSVV